MDKSIVNVPCCVTSTHSLGTDSKGSENFDILTKTQSSDAADQLNSSERNVPCSPLPQVSASCHRPLSMWIKNLHSPHKNTFRSGIIILFSHCPLNQVCQAKTSVCWCL